MSDLDLVEFDVSADQSSTESEKKRIPVDQVTSGEVASLAGNSVDKYYRQ